MKDIQHVLDLPEMKVIKPSDTRWLAHERCVKSVKASYAALVVTLESNYENFHEPEALGINKVLCKFSMIAALILLDYTLTNAANLSKALQAKHLDLTLISTLFDATLESLDDAILPVVTGSLNFFSVVTIFK